MVRNLKDWVDLSVFLVTRFWANLVKKFGEYPSLSVKQRYYLLTCPPQYIFSQLAMASYLWSQWEEGNQKSDWKVFHERRQSVQCSCSVMSNSLQNHESQHARPPCPSPTRRVHPNPCPSSQWCHPAISSSIIPFSSCPQSLPASESFPMSQLFPWGGQSIGVSALASVLPKKSQGWSPSEWTVGSPCSPRDSQESSPTPQFKGINSSAPTLLHSPTLTSIHDHRKNHSLD